MIQLKTLDDEIVDTTENNMTPLDIYIEYAKDWVQQHMKVMTPYKNDKDKIEFFIKDIAEKDEIVLNPSIFWEIKTKYQLTKTLNEKPF